MQRKKMVFTTLWNHAWKHDGGITQWIPSGKSLKQGQRLSSWPCLWSRLEIGIPHPQWPLRQLPSADTSHPPQSRRGMRPSCRGIVYQRSYAGASRRCLRPDLPELCSRDTVHDLYNQLDRSVSTTISGGWQGCVQPCPTKNRFSLLGKPDILKRGAIFMWLQDVFGHQVSAKPYCRLFNHLLSKFYSARTSQKWWYWFEILICLLTLHHHSYGWLFQTHIWNTINLEVW